MNENSDLGLVIEICQINNNRTSQEMGGTVFGGPATYFHVVIHIKFLSLYFCLKIYQLVSTHFENKNVLLRETAQGVLPVA